MAGCTLTKTDKRDAAVEAFAGMVERARKYNGCLDLSRLALTGRSRPRQPLGVPVRPAVLESLTQDRKATESQAKGKLRNAAS
jgi:hypothetical protein